MGAGLAEHDGHVDAQFVLPHRLDGLKDWRARPAREFEMREVEAARIAGRREEPARFRRIVLWHLKRAFSGDTGGNGGRNQLAGRLLSAAKHVGYDPPAVEGQGKSPAHARILQGRAARVERQIAGSAHTAPARSM